MDETVKNIIDNLSNNEPFNGWTGFNSPGQIEKQSGLWITKSGTRYFGEKGFEYDPDNQLHHYEWVAVVEGALIIEHSNTTTIVSKGMYYFMPDNVKMKCRMSNNPLLVWFEFAGPLCKALGPILSNFPDRITTGRYSFDQLKTVLKMAYLLQYRPPGFNLTVQSLLWRFIAETSSSGSFKAPYYSPEIALALNYIKTSPLNQKISVEDLAKASSLTIETFRKRFQSEVGQPPLRYLLHYRIAKAKEMLVNNKELTIKQIAFETGFTDPYYFSKLFKQYENVSPLAFRKKIYHDEMF